MTAGFSGLGGDSEASCGIALEQQEHSLCLAGKTERLCRRGGIESKNGLKMRRRRFIGVLLGAAVASLAACGGGEDRTRVYLVDGYRSELGMRGHLVMRERPLSDPGLGRLVAEVLRGPTAAERDERGLITGFAPHVRVSSVALVAGTATIRLASDAPPRRWPDQQYAAAQLVYTLTELQQVKQVVLTVNHKRCCVYDMRRQPWMKPMTRALFASWQGAPLKSR